MKRPYDHALALLSKAANDLVAAEATLPTGRALDTVCFHAQQAVEKCLKAILAVHHIEYPWRHDLSELVGLVKPLAPKVIPYEDQIIRMTPFAVAIRYDEEFEPTLDEASEALEAAKEIHRLSSSIVERGESQKS